jgi:hypothetical protein
MMQHLDTHPVQAPHPNTPCYHCPRLDACPDLPGGSPCPAPASCNARLALHLHCEPRCADHVMLQGASGLMVLLLACELRLSNSRDASQHSQHYMVAADTTETMLKTKPGTVQATPPRDDAPTACANSGSILKSIGHLRGARSVHQCRSAAREHHIRLTHHMAPSCLDCTKLDASSAVQHTGSHARALLSLRLAALPTAQPTAAGSACNRAHQGDAAGPCYVLLQNRWLRHTPAGLGWPQLLHQAAVAAVLLHTSCDCRVSLGPQQAGSHLPTHTHKQPTQPQHAPLLDTTPHHAAGLLQPADT